MYKHRSPESISDHIALTITKILRLFADTFFAKRYGHRAVVLETVAAVPGMVGGMWIHLTCLRKMKNDRGWIKILLDEAENERMHLMTFIEIAKPKWYERLFILAAQVIFWNFYFLLYVFFPRTAHRLVGYFEDEAVISYTSYHEQVSANPSLNVDAPTIAKDYWNLKSDAKLLDVIEAVRDDEQKHSQVNHGLADTLDQDKVKVVSEVEIKKEEPFFSNSSSLYQRFLLGDLPLFNRIIMAPLTRSRASIKGVPAAIMTTYYQQRASAGLIIAEATQISQQGQGYCATPGIYSEEQTEGWKSIVDAVHEGGGKICLQLSHVGRISHEELQPNNSRPVAPSAIQAKAEVWLQAGLNPNRDVSEKVNVSIPRALEVEEIVGIVEDYRQAAVNAKKAGFDMIDIHAANGYLIDQFLRDGTNHRKDQYGGSIENRIRFLTEIVEAIATIYPPHRIGCRISPVSGFNDISDSMPQDLFNQLAKTLGRRKLAYLHVNEGETDTTYSNLPFDFNQVHLLFKESGGLYNMADNGNDKYRSESTKIDLVAFGIPFISNPDLVYRLEHNLPLNEANEKTFYGGGAEGYTDYPFYPKN
mgnify:FL=1|jgi:N-ethylmaleimide reductase|tara:strand:- start:79 stop:1842 length:1764 start_codon:yes stop_codon:yes gene_type:complete